MTGLIYSLIGILVIVACFKINIFLGIISMIGVAGILWYTNLPNIYASKGNVAYNKGDMNGAVKWYKKAVDTKRAKISISGVYGSLLLRNGQIDEALKHMNRLLSMKLTPKDRNSFKQTRCMIYAKLGNIDEALEDAEEMFEEGYVTGNSYSLVGYLRLLADKMPIEEITKFCEEAYDYDDEHRDILDNLSICYYRMGEYQKAKEISDKLLEQTQTFVEGYYHGAQICLKLGETETAKEYMEKIDECRWSYLTTVSKEEIAALKEEVKKAAGSK